MDRAASGMMAAPRAQRPGLVIHLGPQKTGSTSLQQFLTRNSAALADRLVIRVPEAGTPMRPLGRAAIAYSLGPDAAAEARLADAAAAVRDGLPPSALAGEGPGILISHENLAGAMPGNGGETRLYPMLPRIVAVLDRVFAPLRPVYALYTRPMPDWLASVWAQAVRTDGYDRSWDQFRAETRDLPDWGDLLARLHQAAPGRVQELPLADERDPARPGSQLLRLAGLDSGAIAALAPLGAPAMQRLNPGATEFLRRLNALALNPQARARVGDLVARSQHLFIADHRPEGTI